MRRIEIDFKKLDAWLQLKATKRTCAALLGCSEDTVERRIKELKGISFTEYADQMMAPVKLQLVQKAINMALGGNVTMLIFCLKNINGWQDKVQANITDSNRSFVLTYNLDDEPEPPRED